MILADDILEFTEDLKKNKILDKKELLYCFQIISSFFEYSWIHKYDGKFHFSYSIQESNFIFYAIGDSSYGSFTYKGRIFNPFTG